MARAEGWTPLASVVITSYNYARFLPDAIDSALAQTHPRTEVIVVDDGSADDSPRVIDRYRDRLRGVLKPNGGQASAFNAGLAHARGEIVCFLDSDDVLLPTAVEEAVGALQDPDVSHVHWALWEIDAKGERTGRAIPSSPPAEGWLRERAISQGPLSDVIVPTSGNAWPRWFLEEVFPVPEHEFRTCADAYLFTLSPVLGHLRTVVRPQGCYRVHGDNNYWFDEPLLPRMRLELEWYARRSAVLEEFLRRHGVPAGADDWDRRNGYRTWLRRVVTALEEVSGVVRPGERFLFVEVDQIGTGPIADGRIALPFPNGGGAPGDAATAIAEIERELARGVRYLVFAWMAFWWFEVYPELETYLAQNARRLPSASILQQAPIPGRLQ